MGKIVATCGHEITWEWMDDPRSKCIEKSQTRECGPAISYTVRCEPCREWFAAEGVLLDSEEAADEWMESQREPEVTGTPRQPATYWMRLYAIESERANQEQSRAEQLSDELRAAHAAIVRMEAQIREALAILESGTEYERLHLRGILEAGL